MHSPTNRYISSSTKKPYQLSVASASGTKVQIKSVGTSAWIYKPNYKRVYTQCTPPPVLVSSFWSGLFDRACSCLPALHVPLLSIPLPVCTLCFCRCCCGVFRLSPCTRPALLSSPSRSRWGPTQALRQHAVHSRSPSPLSLFFVTHRCGAGIAHGIDNVLVPMALSAIPKMG